MCWERWVDKGRRLFLKPVDSTGEQYLPACNWSCTSQMEYFSRRAYQDTE